MELIQKLVDDINRIIEEIKNCKGCARRRAKLKRELKSLLKQQNDVQAP